MGPPLAGAGGQKSADAGAEERQGGWLDTIIYFSVRKEGAIC